MYDIFLLETLYSSYMVLVCIVVCLKYMHRREQKSSSSSFGFSLFGVTTARKYFPFLPIDFVSFLSSNAFHVFSCQIHPPSSWPSSFPSTWHRHLHHRFSHVAFFSPFHVAIQRSLAFQSLSPCFAIFAAPLKKKAQRLKMAIVVKLVAIAEVFETTNNQVQIKGLYDKKFKG